MIPKVSAVIFFYNNNDIFELVKIALNQISQFENIIVLNDGSNEYFHTEFLKLYGSYENIIYDRHFLNKGISLAMKTAINKVKTDYFFLMSCGDIYENHLLNDFNSLDWNEAHPGIIASGVFTRKEFSINKNLYLQNCKKLFHYYGNEYENLLYKKANLYYGGGCIINSKFGLITLEYFEELEWAADFFMYHYAAFMSGVIFTNSVQTCIFLHKLRYCDDNNNLKNIKIVSAFIRSSKKIDLNFYNLCSKSAILPVYSFIILIYLIFSLEFRGYVSFYLVYKCIFTDLGKKFKIFFSFKFKKNVRLFLNI